MTPAGRTQAAIALLSAMRAEARAPADALASSFFRSRRYIGAADRRAISGSVWGVLRSTRRLEWWLGPRSPAGEKPASPRLLIAAFLLLSGESTATVQRYFNDGRFGPGPLEAAELAALRRLDGHTLDHPAMPEAVRLELPDCLLAPLGRRFGSALGKELAALGAEAPLDLRVNLLKATRDAAQKALAAEGIPAEPTPFSPWGLRLPGRTPITGTRAFRSGLIEIQDEASQIAALIVGARPRERVADLCAGAGGKTLALAMCMENSGRIVAADVSQSRLAAAARRFSRAGVSNVARHLLAPGDKWAKRHAATFDRVLVDAPCTGTGTWRRHPDARLKIVPEDLAELPARQSAILDLAVGLVRKGGRLVYATCSVLLEENEAQVSGFLTRHDGFAQVSPSALCPALSGLAGEGAGLLLTPARHGTDGFFVALFERRA